MTKQKVVDIIVDIYTVDATTDIQIVAYKYLWTKRTNLNVEN